MDNKKWYKRFGTLFWWAFTILPLIIALIYFIGYHLTFNSGISVAQDLANYHGNTLGMFSYGMENALDYLNNLSIPFIVDTFTNLFDILSIDIYDYLGILIGWMLSVQIYHLAFDLFAWLPMFFHKMLEKSNIGE